VPVDVSERAEQRATAGRVAVGVDLELAFQRRADVAPASQQLGG
jgi:hypothetical protein